MKRDAPVANKNASWQTGKDRWVFEKKITGSGTGFFSEKSAGQFPAISIAYDHKIALD